MLCLMACGILVPRPDTEPELRPLVVKVWSPDHYTAREFLTSSVLNMMSLRDLPLRFLSI